MIFHSSRDFPYQMFSLHHLNPHLNVGRLDASITHLSACSYNHAAQSAEAERQLAFRLRRVCLLRDMTSSSLAWDSKSNYCVSHHGLSLHCWADPLAIFFKNKISSQQVSVLYSLVSFLKFNMLFLKSCIPMETKIYNSFNISGLILLPLKSH